MNDTKAAFLITKWRESCAALYNLEGYTPDYDEALSYRNAVAHEALGAICQALGVCDENGD